LVNMAIKFTDHDRNIIITELEKIQKTKLEQVRPSRKLYKDRNGLFYLIIGGTEEWHGINHSIFNQLKDFQKEGAFVIVKKYKTRLDIYVGSLLTLINNKNRLIKTKKGSYQFHNIITEDGIYLNEIPELFCNKIKEVRLPGYTKDLSRLKAISKIINIEIQDDTPITHSDIQAKLILIGSYLNYRTYTPDRSKQSIYGILGDLCSEKKFPEGSIPALSAEVIKFVDVIWLDEEGYPTHAFEVEHTTDITKGLLRLFQIHKLKIKMFVIAEENSKDKFLKEIQKNPFLKIKEDFIFKNYQELDEFFESVKNFSKIHEKFLNSAV